MSKSLKSELKTGMLVRTHNNTFGYVLRGTDYGDLIKHVGGGGFSLLETYNDDLTMPSRSQKGLDIDEIYATRRAPFFLDLEKMVEYSIWKRVDEPVAMTMEELVALVGKPFKIVDEKSKSTGKVEVAAERTLKPETKTETKVAAKQAPKAKAKTTKAKPTRRKANFVNVGKTKEPINTIADKPSEPVEKAIPDMDSWEREETLQKLIRETKQEMKIPVPIGEVIDTHTKKF